MNFDNFELYLPKYLSADSEKDLFQALKDFPKNIDSRVYTSYLQDTSTIYQGDGLKNMYVSNFPETTIKKLQCIVLSNTCDIAVENIRSFPSQIVYAPILNLRKYENTIRQKTDKSDEQIDAHIQAIKQQRITQIFYLPAIEGKLEESLVFLDRINNCPNSLVDRDQLQNNRIFTLSDFGAYLFLFKISLHFTRIQDKVDRHSN